MLGLENQKESGLRTVDKGSCKYLIGKVEIAGGRLAWWPSARQLGDTEENVLRSQAMIR